MSERWSDQSTRTFSSTANSSSTTRNVFIALGSNVGDSVKNIEAACSAIDQDPDMQIIDTSCLYRSKPMYVEDQNDFVNGACEIETTLRPLELLDRLQNIESELGRIKTIDKGPRNIDLDIIGYANEQVQTEVLRIPHSQLLERPFVLQPLRDLKHGREWVVPPTGRTVDEHWTSRHSDMPMLTPLGPAGMVLDATKSNGQTMLMGIINVTPDSFSGDGEPVDQVQRGIHSLVRRHIRSGATIIDVGGQSSRPDAPDVSATEEIARTLPAIQAARLAIDGRPIAISIDTYRAEVARAAVEAGADIVNDISAGELDPSMLKTVAELGCTYAIMHMRGTPSTMMSKANLTYENGVVDGVAEELSVRVRSAIKAGIRRWRIILDPGIGFAKGAADNVVLLRDLKKLRRHRDFEGLPWLVGSSNKGFIGKYTGVRSPKQRTGGTAATVTAAVAGGAHIVRVHDVKQMAAVVKMSDAIFSTADASPA